MAELGIGHSSPQDEDPALITPLPAFRKPALHGDQELRAYLSEEASHFSAPRCVLFCRVRPVSLLVSEVGVFDCISAPTARRERVGCASTTPAGRRPVIGSVGSPTGRRKRRQSADCVDRAPTERRTGVDRAPAEHPGDEGVAMAEVGLWGLWWLGGPALSCESAGLFMLCIPKCNTCSVFS